MSNLRCSGRKDWGGSGAAESGRSVQWRRAGGLESESEERSCQDGESVEGVEARELQKRLSPDGSSETGRGGALGPLRGGLRCCWCWREEEEEEEEAEADAGEDEVEASDEEVKSEAAEERSFGKRVCTRRWATESRVVEFCAEKSRTWRRKGARERRISRESGESCAERSSRRAGRWAEGSGEASSTAARRAARGRGSSGCGEPTRYSLVAAASSAGETREKQGSKWLAAKERYNRRTLAGLRGREAEREGGSERGAEEKEKEKGDGDGDGDGASTSEGERNGNKRSAGKAGESSRKRRGVRKASTRMNWAMIWESTELRIGRETSQMGSSTHRHERSPAASCATGSAVKDVACGRARTGRRALCCTEVAGEARSAVRALIRGVACSVSFQRRRSRGRRRRKDEEKIAEKKRERQRDEMNERSQI